MTIATKATWTPAKIRIEVWTNARPKKHHEGVKGYAWEGTPWAVHQAHTGSGDLASDSWATTHIPTGYQVGITNSRAEATALAERLQAVEGIDWPTHKPTKAAWKRLPQSVKDAIHAARWP